MKNTESIITDILEKSPAEFRIDLCTDTQISSIYSNNKELIDLIGYYECDYVGFGASEQIISVIQLDEMTAENFETLTDCQLKRRWGFMYTDASSEMSISYSKKTSIGTVQHDDRFLIIGQCIQNIREVLHHIDKWTMEKPLIR